MKSAVLFYAERRLEELKLSKNIWRDLTPKLDYGSLDFSMTASVSFYLLR